MACLIKVAVQLRFLFCRPGPKISCQGTALSGALEQTSVSTAVDETLDLKIHLIVVSYNLKIKFWYSCHSLCSQQALKLSSRQKDWILWKDETDYMMYNSVSNTNMSVASCAWFSCADYWWDLSFAFDQLHCHLRSVCLIEGWPLVVTTVKQHIATW